MDTPAIDRFLAEHREFLVHHETKFNVLLSLALRLEANPRLQKSFRLFSFGRAGAAALQEDQRNIVLGDLGPEDCAKLASFYSNVAYPGVLAPDHVGEWFVAAAGTENFHPPMSQAILQREGRAKMPPVPGGASRADDRYLLIKWLAAFHQEAEGLTLDPEALYQRVEHGTFFFWNVDGEPVAMAAVVREGIEGATIGAVYTVPEHRGRRYGEAVTAAVAAHILESGKRFSNLYVDLANAAAQKIYARLGYQQVATSMAFRRKRSEAG